MGLADVTREGVLSAIREYDEVGGPAFLRRYGFRRALAYDLVFEGRRYDSKAIAGVAHRHSEGTVLASVAFTGGANTVGRRLSALGFTIEHRAPSSGSPAAAGSPVHRPEARPQLVLQPRGGVRVHGPRHFAHSVRRGVRIAAHRQELGEHADLISSLYPDGTARLWGSTPTALSNNAKARALRGRRVGDEVLFYAEKSFIARATILHVFRSRALALAVWGKDEDGATWEHIMALGEVEEFATPVPAAPVLTRLGIADTLRSITLASATERESVQEFLPPQRRPRTPVRRAPVESAAPQPNPEEFIERLRHLRSVPPGAVHGPWTLLRAIARTTTGAPRLSQWSEIRQEIGSLVAELTPVGSAAPPKDRFWDLRSSGVWEVHGADAVDGSPLAGLTPEAARLLSDPQTRAEAIAALRGSHLAAVDQHTLLVRLGLGGYDTASGLADETDATDERQQAGPAARLTTTISRPVRDSRLVSTVKRLHGHQCQFCGLRLRTRDGHYSEGAHIRGLGRPHHGPDILANLLCLCPNHHVQFDQLAVYVDEDDIVRTTYGTAPVGQLRRHPEHAIDNAFLGYHRSLCGRNS